MLSAAFSCFAQVSEHARRAVNSTTDGVRIANEPEQTFIFDRAIRQRLVQPLVETGTRDLQHAAHRREAEFMPVLVDEAVLYSGSLAKYPPRLFLEYLVLLRSDAAAPAASISRSSLRSAQSLLLSLVGGHRLHPLIKAMGRHPESGRDLHHRIATIDDLPNGFFLEFRGVSLRSHGLLSYAQIIGEHCSRNQGKSKS